MKKLLLGGIAIFTCLDVDTISYLADRLVFPDYDYPSNHCKYRYHPHTGDNSFQREEAGVKLYISLFEVFT